MRIVYFVSAALRGHELSSNPAQTRHAMKSILNDIFLAVIISQSPFLRLFLFKTSLPQAVWS